MLRASFCLVIFAALVGCGDNGNVTTATAIHITITRSFSCKTNRQAGTADTAAR
jgi:hypothetical protein